MNLTKSDALEPIYQAIAEDRPALLLSGRNLRDLDWDPEDGQLRPLLIILQKELQRRGLALLTYSLAEGLDYDDYGWEDSDRQIIRDLLKLYHLDAVPQDEEEVPHMVRGLSGLCRHRDPNLKWHHGQPMQVCVLFFFTEHLMPQCHQGATTAQLVTAELCHLIAQSLALRTSGNLLWFHTQEESHLDPLVRSVLHQVRLSQPKQTQKERFLAIAQQKYPQAQLEQNLTWDSIAFLTANTPNRGIEALMRAAHRTGKPLTAQQCVAQKSRDVQTISEQTLTVLDTSAVNPEQPLQGINSSYPQKLLHHLAKGLGQGNPSIPANVLLVGPPGTGKTEMSLMVAKTAGVSAYQMHSPKTGIVGETERKAELQQRVLREWTPNVAFVDEITEALPLERSDFDGDSGATRAVSAALLTALADESRRGQSLLIATTNCPWRMGAAMRSRFVAIPVLQPLPQDYPAIVVAMATRLGGGDWSSQDPLIQQAAQIFAKKGANPRHIRGALTNALLLKERLDSKVILFAAQDMTLTTDRVSAIYSDLWAIKACSSRSFLPWAPNLAHYEFPSHLQKIVNPTTGTIDTAALDHRLQELEPHANL